MGEKEIKLHNDVFYYINEDSKTATVVGFKNSTKVGEVPNVIEGMKVSRMTNGISGYRFTSLKEITVSSGILLDSKIFHCSHSLEKAVLKSGVVLLGGTFESCSNLKEVILENGVIIDNTPVLRCAKRDEELEKHYFFIKEKPSKQSDAPRIWVECFNQNLDPSQEGVSYQRMENDGIFSDCESLTDIEIPEGIEILPFFTFARCSSLCRVILPHTLKVIGAGCFAACSNLINIVIPEGVVAIGEDAFGGCTKLETVVLPSTLTHLVGNPLKKCNSLKRIVVPEGMAGIDGSEELADEIYRYVSCFTIGYTSFNKKDFYSKKSWKQIFKSKQASLITTEKPSAEELKEKEDLAIEHIKEQGEFDKIKLLTDDLSECFLENSSSFNYKKKDISLLRKRIIAYIDALQKISKENYSNKEMILDEVRQLVEYINAFNEKFEAVETEERESLCEIIDRCIILAGFPYPNPQTQTDFDLTYEWRKW